MNTEKKQSLAGGILYAGVCIVWFALFPVASFLVETFCRIVTCQWNAVACYSGCGDSTIAVITKMILPACVMLPAIKIVDEAISERNKDQ